MLKGKMIASMLAGAILIVATGCTVENPPADAPASTNTVVHDTTAVPVAVPGPSTHTSTNTVTNNPPPTSTTVVTPGGSATTTTTPGSPSKTTTTTTTGG